MSQLVSKNSEFNEAKAELEPTESRLRATKDAFSLKPEPVQKQGPQLHKVKAARLAAKVARGAAECIVQSLTVSASSLRGKVAHIAQHVMKLEDEVARMLQECFHKAEDVIFKRDELQVRLLSMASKLPKFRNSLTVAYEQLEQHRGRSAASRLQLESFLGYSVSGWSIQWPAT